MLPHGEVEHREERDDGGEASLLEFSGSHVSALERAVRHERAGTFNLNGYLQVLTLQSVVTLLNTVGISLAKTIPSLVLAVLLAWILARTDTPMRRRAFPGESPIGLLPARDVAVATLRLIRSDLTGQVLDVRRHDGVGQAAPAAAPIGQA